MARHKKLLKSVVDAIETGVYPTMSAEAEGSLEAESPHQMRPRGDGSEELNKQATAPGVAAEALSRRLKSLDSARELVVATKPSEKQLPAGPVQKSRKAVPVKELSFGQLSHGALQPTMPKDVSIVALGAWNSAEA